MLVKIKSSNTKSRGDLLYKKKKITTELTHVCGEEIRSSCVRAYLGSK